MKRHVFILSSVRNPPQSVLGTKDPRRDRANADRMVKSQCCGVAQPCLQQGGDCEPLGTGSRDRYPCVQRSRRQRMTLFYLYQPRCSCHFLIINSLFCSASSWAVDSSLILRPCDSRRRTSPSTLKTLRRHPSEHGHESECDRCCRRKTCIRPSRKPLAFSQAIGLLDARRFLSASVFISPSPQQNWDGAD